jgi:hypothetical protein
VTRQLLDHSQTEDRTLHGVVEHMEADQARVQTAVGRSVFLLRFRLRHPFTKGSIKTTTRVCQCANSMKRRQRSSSYCTSSTLRLKSISTPKCLACLRARSVRSSPEMPAGLGVSEESHLDIASVVLASLLTSGCKGQPDLEITHANHESQAGIPKPRRCCAH